MWCFLGVKLLRQLDLQKLRLNKVVIRLFRGFNFPKIDASSFTLYNDKTA